MDLLPEVNAEPPSFSVAPRVMVDKLSRSLGVDLVSRIVGCTPASLVQHSAIAPAELWKLAALDAIYESLSSPAAALASSVSFSRLDAIVAAAGAQHR